MVLLEVTTALAPLAKASGLKAICLCGGVDKADQQQALKVGAQVMLIKNDTKSPKRWVNGSIGVVTELSEDNIHLKIKNKVCSWE